MNSINKCFLHLGESVTVMKSSIVGIFDLDNSSISQYTRDFLRVSTEKASVVNVSYELPKSFVVCKNGEEITIYISQLSSATLKKRYYSN